MSLRVTLNAPTTIRNEGCRGQTTYLEYGKIYCMSILDTTNDPNNPCNIQYHTSVDLVIKPDEIIAESRLHSSRGEEIGHSVWATPECTDLPILRYVPHTDISSCGSSTLQTECQNATANSFSVAWASSPVTGGRYCLVQIIFWEPTRGNNDHPSRLLALRARTQRTTDESPGTLYNSTFEECFAQIQLFQPDEATARILDDIQRFHQSVGRLQNLLRQLGCEIGHLRERRAQKSRTEKLKIRHVHLANHVPQGDQCLEKEAVAKFKAIGDMEAKLSNLQAILSSVQPVTMFRHHTLGGNSRGPLDEMIDSRQNPKPSRPPEDAVNTFTPHTNVNAAVYIVASLLQSSALLTDADANTRRSSMTETKLQRWLDTIERTRNEIHRSKNTMLALQTESSWRQDNKMRPGHARPARDSILPKTHETKFQFYIRATNDIKASHRAIFIRERTLAALLDGIVEKIPTARERSFMLYILDSDGLRRIVDADVLSHMPDGQDLILDHGSPVLDPISVSPCEPYSSLESIPCRKVTDEQSLNDYFDFDTPVTDVSYHTESDMNGDGLTRHSIHGVTSLDLSSRSSNYSDINDEHQICAVTLCDKSMVPKKNWQKYLLPDLECSWEEMEIAERSDAKLEADPTLNKFLTSDENLQSELEKFGPKPKQTKRRVKKSTVRKVKPQTYDGERIKEDDSSVDQQISAKRRVTLDKNKHAAARCRVKKKELVRSQNEELKIKVQENTVLLETVLELRTKTHWMATMLAEHDSCFDGST